MVVLRPLLFTFLFPFPLHPLLLFTFLSPSILSFFSLPFPFHPLLFVRDGILSVADYNSTRVGVVVVVVVVNTFLQWDNLRTL